MAPIDIQLLEYFHNAYLEIYQIYGQTEIGMICGNTTFNNKIGTVGKPILQIHIADDGEVITYNEYPTVNNYYLDDGTVQPLPPHERPSGDIGDIDDEGFVTLRGRKNEAIILSNGKKVNPVEIENRIKNKFNLDEVLIFKRNDAESEHILDIVVFYGVGGKEMTNAKDIKDVISEYQELKYNSEEIRLSLFMIEDSEKTAIYTENGKFSRVNAAKFIKSNIDRLENINYMR